MPSTYSRPPREIWHVALAALSAMLAIASIPFSTAQELTILPIDAYGRTFLGIGGKSESALWAVGEDGVVFRSTDMGTEWRREKDAPSTSRLIQVHFASEQVGWILGPLEHLETRDGGASWSSHAYPWPNYIQFINDSTGWRLLNGNLEFSTDAGISWGRVADSVEFNKFQFTSQSVGYATRSFTTVGEVWKTTNSGANWSLQTEEDMSITDLFFLSEDTGWAVGSGGLALKTTDGGATWNALSVSEEPTNFVSVRFFDTSVGLVLSEGGLMFRTDDGGATFQALDDARLPWLGTLEIFGSSRAIAVGTRGQISRSIDRGATWQDARSGLQSNIRSAAFLDENLGWHSSASAWFYKTENGGRSWQTETLPDGIYGSISLFAVGDTVYAADIDVSNRVWKWTRESGEWTKLIIPSGLYVAPRRLFFATESIGWIVGKLGRILHTTDGGSTWSAQTTGSINTLNDVHFFGAQIGWAVSDHSNYVLHTTDGGANWSPVPLGVFDSFKAVAAIDESTIFVVGSDIYRSQDGGETWETHSLGAPLSRAEICFLDDRNGIIGIESYGGEYALKTTDGGDSWTMVGQGDYVHFAPYSSDAMYAFGIQREFARIKLETDSSFQFRILSISRDSDSTIAITTTSVAGASYAVETSKTLVQGSWQPLLEIVATGDTTTFVVALPDDAKTFFRIKSIHAQ